MSRGHLLAAALGALLTAPIAIADELRFGVKEHNTAVIGVAADSGRESGPALTLEYAWTRPEVDFAPFVTLSPNLAGDMSFAAAGVEYRFERGPWRMRPAAGVALHDGCTRGCADLVNLGTQAQFYLRLDVGRRLTDRLALYVRAEHLSNAGASDTNPGMEEIGLVLEWRF